jgi:hypothetical protein
LHEPLIDLVQIQLSTVLFRPFSIAHIFLVLVGAALVNLRTQNSDCNGRMGQFGTNALTQF